MTRDQLEALLLATEEELLEALDRAQEAQEGLERAQHALQDAEADHVMAGLEGKNDLARKSELATLTRDEVARVRAAERDVSRARLWLDRARIRQQTARYLVRLYASSDVE